MRGRRQPAERFTQRLQRIYRKGRKGRKGSTRSKQIHRRERRGRREKLLRAGIENSVLRGEAGSTQSQTRFTAKVAKAAKEARRSKQIHRRGRRGRRGCREKLLRAGIENSVLRGEAGSTQSQTRFTAKDAKAAKEAREVNKFTAENAEVAEKNYLGQGLKTLFSAVRRAALKAKPGLPQRTQRPRRKHEK
jgi:hypothetical protein